MELTIELASEEEARFLFGNSDSHLRALRDQLDLQISSRNGSVKLVGAEDRVEHASGILYRMMSMFRTGQSLPEHYVEQQLVQLARQDAARRGKSDPAAPLSEGERALVRGLARSKGQGRYLETLLRNDVVFAIGPAGTGKTYLAVRMAVNCLRAGEVRRIVLCRPAVEAGEKLGFLPGDFQAKINPYLRPLYDALNDILGFDQVKRYLEREIIEIIPLAYMRGRTLNNAFIILDEGQNTVPSQMKMFLTRLGIGSRMVVNGDITQLDLPDGQLSGLAHAHRLIREISGIAWVELGKADIVRHSLVQRIVEAYEAYEAAENR